MAECQDHNIVKEDYLEEITNDACVKKNSTLTCKTEENCFENCDKMDGDPNSGETLNRDLCSSSPIDVGLVCNENEEYKVDQTKEKKDDIVAEEEDWGSGCDEGGGYNCKYFGNQMKYFDEDVPDCIKDVLRSAESVNPIERQISCRHLVDALEVVSESPDDVDRIFTTIDRLSIDTNPGVITQLIEHIFPIARFCHETEHLSHLISERLVPILLKYLMAPNFQGIAQECLRIIRLQNFIDEKIVSQDIFPVIINLTYSIPSSGEYRGNVITLITKMANVLGREATEKFFVPRILLLSMDSDPSVRKMCITNFGEFCSAVSTQVTENVLLPYFIRSCYDCKWEVRKACAEVIISVSCACRLETRKSMLAPVCASLLSDINRSVRMAAFQTLGPFITTFAEPSITGLAYNCNGQLVLTNWSGFEFRTSFDDNFPEMKENDSSSPLMPILCQENFNALSDESNYGFNSSGCDSGITFIKNMTSSIIELANDNVKIEISPSNGLSTVIVNNNHSDDKSTSNNEDLNQNILQEYDEFLYWRDPIPVLDDVDLLGYPHNNLYKYEEVKNKNQLETAEHPQLNNSCLSNSINNNNYVNFKKIAPNCSSTKDENSPPVMEMLMIQMYDRLHSELKCNDLTYKQISGLSSCNSSVGLKHTVGGGLIKVPGISRKKPCEKPRQNIVPQELIDYFVSLSDPVDGNSNDNNFLVSQVAYSLPAVAQTLGKENWSLLKNVHEKLAADKTWKVRRAIASSIHELAAIVGQDNATQDLIPVFNNIMKDVDEVRIGALSHLASFLKTLRPAGRNSLLPKLSEFLMTDSDMNWRFRAELAKQLLHMVGLFSAADTYTHLMPLAILLLLDKVAAVRHVALSLVAELVSWISIDTRLLDSILVELADQFAHSCHWNRRQTFALLCSQLVSRNILSEDTFAISLLPHLLDLSWDSVPNVRIAVARTLASEIAYSPYFSDPHCPHHEVVVQTLNRLQADRDRDVQFLALSKPSSESPLFLSDNESQETA